MGIHGLMKILHPLLNCAESTEENIINQRQKKNELKQICKELEKRKRKLIRKAKLKWNGKKEENDNDNVSNINPSTPPPMIMTPEPPLASVPNDQIMTDPVIDIFNELYGDNDAI